MSWIPVDHVNGTLFSRFNHFWTTFGTSVLHRKLFHRNKHLHLAKSTTVYKMVFMLTFFQPRVGKRCVKFAGTKTTLQFLQQFLMVKWFFSPSFAWQWEASVLRNPRQKPFLLKIWWRPLTCLGWGEFVWNSLVVTQFSLCHLCDSSHVLSLGDCRSPFLYQTEFGAYLHSELWLHWFGNGIQLTWSPANLSLPKDGVKEQIPHQQEVGNTPKSVIHKTQTSLKNWEANIWFLHAKSNSQKTGWDYLGCERKRAVSFSCVWFMSIESHEEHRLIQLVLVLTMVINNSFCKVLPLSHLALQQGWLPHCSSRSNGKEKVLEAAAEEPELQLLLSEQHRSDLCQGHWGEMVSPPVWSETILHSIMIFMALKNKITPSTEFQVI